MKAGKKSWKELSPVEWEIMNVVWQSDSPVTVRDVIDIAYSKSEKAYTTVQTFMNILVDKGFLKRVKKNRVNTYFPVLDRETVLRLSMSTIVKRMFRGSFGTMASYLVDSGGLSPEELVELREILDEKLGDHD